jgi:hypothetical protein
MEHAISGRREAHMSLRHAKIDAWVSLRNFHDFSFIKDEGSRRFSRPRVNRRA